MSETFATVGVFLTEDERKHLVRLCEELEALEESALRNNEGPEAQTRAAERAALRKLMFLPAQPSGDLAHERNMQALGFGPPDDRYRLGPVPKYEALGNGDLTPEQLDGMSMWDRDVMLDERHRAAGSYLVKRAVAEIRRRRAADASSVETVSAIVRSAIEWAHQQSLSKSFDDHLVNRLVEQISSTAPSAARVHTVVRDAVGALAGMGQWPPHPELCEAIASRVVAQLAFSGTDPSPSRQTIADAFIAGAAWVNDHAQITDSGCGASIDMPTDADVEKAADQFAAESQAPDVAAAIRHLHETSERAPDVRAVPMRLVRQDAFDAILALVGGKP